MPPEPTQQSIGDLARLAGVTPRTIRYYVAQGLLPTPSGVGPGAHYGPGHLERLQLIGRLKRQHLPLAEIRSQLESLTDGQVAELNRGAPDRPTPTSALEYVRSVLGPPVPDTGTPPRPMAAALASPAGPTLQSMLTMPPPQEVPPAEPTTEPTLERSQWERLSLGPNLELHIRRPLSRPEQRRVERLITIARQVLKEEMP